MNNQELLDHVVGFAKSTFTASGQIMPMWILVNDKGEQFVYSTAWTSDIEKDLMSLMIKREIAVHKAERIAFISETWVYSAPVGMSEAEAMKIPPSQRPDRREAVYIAVEDKDGQALAGSIEILRDKKGKGRLADFEPAKFTSTKGRFANMFGTRVVN